MTQQIAPFLMFEGQAEEAMRFYVSAVPSSRIERIERYGSGEEGAEGSVKLAHFTLSGRTFMCIDSPASHAFTFTPSISLFLTCDTPEEVDEIFGKLSQGGGILMPLDAYPFSPRFGWCNDRFGVSWQVTVPTMENF
ncbi:VOC family protein [Chelativorans sp. AA-79]|uniref:VOC family protein n=1 Tax=Chelativorans sp. AA-79 TaxID=3028735 RepID=UPI0023F6B989|nr:VOC family protein [Chelativorans sp. AA-79]WEX09445.1 VOC family protein [Chelativorans sp. AA-79]